MFLHLPLRLQLENKKAANRPARSGDRSVCQLAALPEAAPSIGRRKSMAPGGAAFTTMQEACQNGCRWIYRLVSADYRMFSIQSRRPMKREARPIDRQTAQKLGKMRIRMRNAQNLIVLAWASNPGTHDRRWAGCPPPHPALRADFSPEGGGKEG